MDTARSHGPAGASLIILALLTVAAAVVSSAVPSSVAPGPAFGHRVLVERTNRTDPGPGPAPSLCRAPAKVTGLSMTRTDPYSPDQISFTFPSTVTSADQPAISALERTMCALAPVPPGAVYHCPADFGVRYLVAFSVRHQTVATVTVNPAGCQRMTGLGSPRLLSPLFWARLASALALPSPGPSFATFAGRMPSAPSDGGPPIG